MIRAVAEVSLGAALLIYDKAWDWLVALVTPAPKGSTLRQRYPPAPGAFVTHYSSIDLPDEAFVDRPRCYRCNSHRSGRHE
jgi:hypothetical protein